MSGVGPQRVGPQRVGPQRIRDLPGLGEKSEESLSRVGIHTVAELRVTGPLMAYQRLCLLAAETGQHRPGMNFLYALVGGLSGRSWQEVARTDKASLLAGLDAMEHLGLSD